MAKTDKQFSDTTYSPVIGENAIPETMTEKQRSSDAYMPGAVANRSSGVHKTQKQHLAQVKNALPFATGGSPAASAVDTVGNLIQADQVE